MKSGPVVAVVLSRMTSSRLPGKALVDICGEPNLQHMLGRVQRARKLDAVVVATTTNRTDEPIVDLCRALSVPVARGSEDDVLARTFAAAAAQRAATVVRLTADCPMIDPALIDEVIEFYEAGHWDYASNANVRSYPDGLDVEVMSITALRQANAEATAPFLREHVTPYIRASHPEHGCGVFRVGDVVCPWDFSHVRWTLDTAADLDVIRTLVSRLPDGYGWMHALAQATREPRLLGTLVTGIQDNA
jgi:spore coat polysaccharide biosynthesis protein SpsF